RALDEEARGDLVDAREALQRLVVLIAELDVTARAVSLPGDAGLPGRDPDAVGGVVAELVLDAVREALPRAEQHHQHEHAPRDREAGERGAQLVARHRLEDLAPGVRVKHGRVSGPGPPHPAGTAP